MKTAEETLKNIGCIYHENGTPLYPYFNVLEAMKEYAIEVAKEALRNAADNVELKESIPHSAIYDTIDKESILSETNIPKI